MIRFWTNLFRIRALGEYFDLCSRPTNAHRYNMFYHILLITYMSESLFSSSSSYFTCTVYSEVKCSDVRWNGAVRNLNGVKPNERVVKCSEVQLDEFYMGRSEMSTSVAKWSEALRNRSSIIIRIYTGHMTFAASFVFVWFYFVSSYMWLYIMYSSV